MFSGRDSGLKSVDFVLEGETIFPHQAQVVQ